MVKKKKEIKIIPESEVNYTFVDTGLSDIKQESEEVDKSNSSIEKDIIRTRLIDSNTPKLKVLIKLIF